MKLILDTNICIAIIKQKPANILQKFSAYQVGDICISSVTLAELRYGVAKSQYQEKNQAALDEFILPLEVVGFDEAAALVYGALRASLEKRHADWRLRCHDRRASLKFEFDTSYKQHQRI
jgi:tRNA(fMet)-specific endonuclease VapC